MYECVRYGRRVGSAHAYNYICGSDRTITDAAADCGVVVNGSFRRCHGNRRFRGNLFHGNGDTSKRAAADVAGAGAGPVEGAGVEAVENAGAGAVSSSVGERPAADTRPGSVADAGGAHGREIYDVCGVGHLIIGYTVQAYSQYVIFTVLLCATPRLVYGALTLFVVKLSRPTQTHRTA